MVTFKKIIYILLNEFNIVDAELAKGGGCIGFQFWIINFLNYKLE